MATFSTPIHPSEKRRPKYGNKKTENAGVKHDSKKEAERWNDLEMLAQASEIGFLKRHPRFELTVNGVKICTYVADSAYTDFGPKKRGPHVRVVEDVKGVKTAAYKLKKKLMLACHGISIKEV